MVYSGVTIAIHAGPVRIDILDSIDRPITPTRDVSIDPFNTSPDPTVIHRFARSMRNATKPKVRALRTCAQVASLMVIFECTDTSAQAPVVTLGIPSAKGEQGLPWLPSVLADENLAQAEGKAQLDAARIDATVQSALPMIRVNAFVGNHNDGATQDISELFHGLQSKQNTTSQSDQPTAGGHGRIAAFSGPKNGTQEMIASRPRSSETPLEPKLSPAQWVHQPLVARQQDRPERLARQSSVTAIESYSQADLSPGITSVNTSESATAVLLGSTADGHVGQKHLTEIRRAAMRQRANRTEENYDRFADSEPVQTGYSIDTLRRSAMDLIAEAQLKLEIRAYLTAEEKAKKALELITQSIDARQQSAIASRDLMIALTAIREAEDFVGKYGMVDGDAINRMVRSHSTEALKPYNTSNLNGVAAADIYLDWARRCITPIAVADPLAAEAIRILSQSHRLRDNGTPFGIATSVHLIRAAAAGAPNSAQVRVDFEKTMQVAGLSGESLGRYPDREIHGTETQAVSPQVATGRDRNQDAMVVTVSAVDGRQKQDVRIIEVTPEEFATISPAMAGPAGNTNTQTVRTSRDLNPKPGAASGAASEQSGKSRLSRVFEPITRVWR